MKTIVIDDEPLMLRHFCDECVEIPEIELAGQFRNPVEALVYAQDNPLDLVFIDIEMPRLKGPDLARKIIKLNPGIKVVFVSAYDIETLEDEKFVTQYGYLRKPYLSEDLAQAVKDVMRSSAV